MSSARALVTARPLILRCAGLACYLLLLGGLAVTVSSPQVGTLAVDATSWRVPVFGVGLLGIGLLVAARGRRRARP